MIILNSIIFYYYTMSESIICIIDNKLLNVFVNDILWKLKLLVLNTKHICLFIYFVGIEFDKKKIYI